VIPRAFSSGALSIESTTGTRSSGCASANLGDGRRQRRLAMVNVTNRPTLQCGLFRSNFSFAIFFLDL